MKIEQGVPQDLLEFIRESPSAYHVVDNIRKGLLAQGFYELKEKDSWNVERGKGYFVIHNDSSIIAIRIPKDFSKGFHVIAAHGDSPTFKVKDNPEISVEGKYVKLNTEKYGGMIHSTWLDRPLSVAGRVVVKSAEGGPKVRLVNVDRDLLVIPNLSIHMNRDINKGFEYNPQSDLLPLMCLEEGENKGLLKEEVAKSAGVDAEDILAEDLYLYIRERGYIVGRNGEFVLSPRLDDLQCVHASYVAFREAENREYINVLAVFDNEEVGSTTAQGADSTFMQDTLRRIGECLGWGQEQYYKMLAESFLISADNAHAVHPNHPEKSDPTNRPYLGGGIVIKYHGGCKYTTDAFSSAKLKLLCEKAQVPYQTFYNRSDMAGGSTLGNILSSHVAMSSVDMGLPQLSMHSAMEMASGNDSVAAIKVFGEFYRE